MRSDAQENIRRRLLRGIRAAAAPHMTSVAGDGVGFLFTRDGGIRYRALPGTGEFIAGEAS